MGNIGVDLSQFLPPPPDVGSTDKETIENLMQFCNRLISGFYEYAQMMQTKATIASGFTSMTDGTNTQYASDDAVLHFAGGEAMTVEYVEGTMTFVVNTSQINTSNLNNDAGWTANTTYAMSGNAFNALITGGNVGVHDGDTCYITADSISGTARYQGETYRFTSGTPGTWTKTGHWAHSTTISAGKIVLSSCENDAGYTKTATYSMSGNAFNTLIADGNVGINDGDTCYIKSNSSSGTNRYLGETYRYDTSLSQWEKINQWAWATTVNAGYISLVSIDIGGGSKLDDLLMHHDLWSEDNPSGLYMTTQYVGYWDTTNNIWRVWIGNDGKLYLKNTTNVVSLEADNGIAMTATGPNYPSIWIKAYTGTSTYLPELLLCRSGQTTVGYTATGDGLALGAVEFCGVDTGAAGFKIAGSILCYQDGAAASGYIPGKVKLQVRSGASAYQTWEFDKAGKLSCPGDLYVNGNTFTGSTEAPTVDPGWRTSSSVDMTAPNGYIKAYVGAQAVSIPYWNT